MKPLIISLHSFLFCFFLSSPPHFAFQPFGVFVFPPIHCAVEKVHQGHCYLSLSPLTAIHLRCSLKITISLSDKMSFQGPQILSPFFMHWFTLRFCTGSLDLYQFFSHLAYSSTLNMEISLSPEMKCLPAYMVSHSRRWKSSF